MVLPLMPNQRGRALRCAKRLRARRLAPSGGALPPAIAGRRATHRRGAGPQTQSVSAAHMSIRYQARSLSKFFFHLGARRKGSVRRNWSFDPHDECLGGCLQAIGDPDRTVIRDRHVHIRASGRPYRQRGRPGLPPENGARGQWHKRQRSRSCPHRQHFAYDRDRYPDHETGAAMPGAFARV